MIVFLNWHTSALVLPASLGVYEFTASDGETCKRNPIQSPPGPAILRISPFRNPLTLPTDNRSRFEHLRRFSAPDKG